MSTRRPPASSDSVPRHLPFRLLCGAAMGGAAAGLVGLAAGIAPLAALVGAPAGLAVAVLLGSEARNVPDASTGAG